MRDAAQGARAMRRRILMLLEFGTLGTHRNARGVQTASLGRPEITHLILQATNINVAAFAKG
jgi:hypothetical protein